MAASDGMRDWMHGWLSTPLRFLNIEVDSPDLAYLQLISYHGHQDRGVCMCAQLDIYAALCSSVCQIHGRFTHLRRRRSIVNDPHPRQM